jgi:hypothetical protein
MGMGIALEIEISIEVGHIGTTGGFVHKSAASWGDTWRVHAFVVDPGFLRHVFGLDYTVNRFFLHHLNNIIIKLHLLNLNLTNLFQINHNNI